MCMMSYRGSELTSVFEGEECGEGGSKRSFERATKASACVAEGEEFDSIIVVSS